MRLIIVVISGFFLFSACGGSETAKPGSQGQTQMEENSLSIKIAAIKKQIEANQLKEAEKDLNLLLTDYPDHLEVNLLLAQLYYQQKDYAKSLGFYEKMIHLGENKADVLFQVGQNYTQMKNYYSALASYKKAIELDPMLTEAYLKIGDIYLEWKNFNQASRWYERAVKTEQKVASVYFHMAKMSFDTTQFKRAAEQLRQVFEIDANHLDARILEMKILQNTGMNAALVQKTTDFVKDFPENAEGYLFLGKLYLDLRELKKSLDYYKKSLQLAPQSASSYNGMGNYYYELKDYKKANEYYSKSLEMSPNYANAYYNIGLSEWKLGNLSKAREHFMKAYELNQWFKEALLFSSICAFQGGLEEQAMKELVTFYERDALLYAGYLKNQEYAVPMGQILQSFWKYYDRNSSFDRGFFVCLVDSREKAITILTRESRPEADFLLSRIYLLMNETQKARASFEKYLASEKLNRETILLDSTYNEFKTQDWFLEALEKVPSSVQGK